MTTLPQTSPMRLPRPNPSHLAIPSANGHPAPALGHVNAPAMTGADVWRVIRSNLWLIVGLAIAGGVAGFFVNMWLAANYARYTSTAMIRVQTAAEIPQLGDEGRLLMAEPSPANIEVEQQTQAASITNRYFIGSILEDPNSPIRKTSWFQSWGTRVDEAKQDLLDKLEVTPRPTSRLIAVSMSCRIPYDALVIVREIVNRHIAERQEKMRELQIQKSQNLQHLIDDYQARVNSYQQQISTREQSLAKSYDSGDNRTSGLSLMLTSYIQSQVGADREFHEAQRRYANFNDSLKSNLTPLELQELLGRSQPAAQLSLNDLKARLAVARDRFGDKSQTVQELETMIKASAEQSDESEGVARDKLIAALQKDLKSKVDATQAQLEGISRQINAVQNQLATNAKTQFELKDLEKQEQNTSDLLQRAKHDYDHLQLFIQQNNWSTAELANPADLPERPSFPRLPITMSAAIAMGLVLALGIAFLRELMDTSVRSPRDIAKVGQLNLLGMIPHEADDPESAGARLPLAIYEAPHSVIAEQFRQVRTRLQHSASLDTVRSLLVTGTAPGDGKTTVACNLAAGLALNGRRILLVDANFRRPQVHSIFNLPNEIGFGDVLNSLDAFEQSVRESEVPNLSVLVSGAKPANPTELLESQLLIDFIERALEEYDHVIFDSGPLLIVSETAALAPRVDGVVTVVRARGNSRGMLQRLRDQLRQLKAENLGVILNAVRSQSGGYYAPMIKSYYAYQNG